MKNAIEKRISVRSYEKRSLSKDDVRVVQDILDDVEKKKGPFNLKWTQCQGHCKKRVVLTKV